MTRADRGRHKPRPSGDGISHPFLTSIRCVLTFSRFGSRTWERTTFPSPPLDRRCRCRCREPTIGPVHGGRDKSAPRKTGWMYADISQVQCLYLGEGAFPFFNRCTPPEDDGDKERGDGIRLPSHRKPLDDRGQSPVHRRNKRATAYLLCRVGQSLPAMSKRAAW